MIQTTPSRNKRINAVALRNLVAALMSGPHDYYELAEITGLSHSTIRRWLAPWRHRSTTVPLLGEVPVLVHIAEWHEDPRGVLARPAFALKRNGRDVPQPFTAAAERKRKTRARQRALHQTAVLAQAQMP